MQISFSSSLQEALTNEDFLYKHKYALQRITSIFIVFLESASFQNNQLKVCYLLKNKIQLSTFEYLIGFNKSFMNLAELFQQLQVFLRGSTRWEVFTERRVEQRIHQHMKKRDLFLEEKVFIMHIASTFYGRGPI